MKELKDICVNLEIAKQLKEKGFPQDSIYYKTVDKKDGRESGGFKSIGNERFWIYYASPTAEELLAELPKDIQFGEVELGGEKSVAIYRLTIYYEDVYRVHYSFLQERTDKKLCNALAKMWMYLKDNNLLGKNLKDNGLLE